MGGDGEVKDVTGVPDTAPKPRSPWKCGGQKRTAVTNYHKLSGLYNKNIFLSSGG